MPELSASLDLPQGSLSNLAVADGWLCGAAGETGLVVPDVRDPTQPSLFATVATDKPAAAIALGGESLLVGVGASATEGGLRVFERTEPAAPGRVGAIDVGQKGNAVVSVGSCALLATWENAYVIDLADPARPQIVSQLRAYGGSTFAFNDNRVFLLRSPLAVRERPQLCALDTSALPDVRNLGELPLWNGYGVASAGEQVLAADGECGLSDSRARGRRRGATRRTSSRSDDR